MKIAPLILPTIALALAGIWVADQRRSISALEGASASLQKHLVTARSGSPATDPSSAKPAKHAAHATATKGKEALAWKKLAAEFLEMKPGSKLKWAQSSLDLQILSLSMSQEELVAALDGISALDSPAKKRAELEQILFWALTEKDPKLAVTRYLDRIHDKSGKMPERLPSAMQAWAQKDPAEAIAWFDQQIAAGQFDSKSLDGKSETRNQFEKVLIQALLGKDPATVSRRLCAMTPDQRVEVLGGWWLGHEFIRENYLSFATLVRSQVPEKEQVEILAQQAGRMVCGTDDGDFARALDFMDRIAATSAERIACAEQATKNSISIKSHNGKITRTDLDAIREWTKAQAPDSTDRVTGEAIAGAMDSGQNLDFAAASELVLHYHQASGNDDVLTSFLAALPRRKNTEQARALALKITNVERREELLQKFK